jgi:hypothetical protein
MGRKGEKKVVVWKYAKDAAAIDVVVYIVDQSNRPSYRDDKAKTFFRVSLPELDIEIEDPNIDNLKTLVWSELDSKLSINWTDWLYVDVDGDIDPIVRKQDADEKPEEDPNELIAERASCSVSVSYRRVQLGEFGGTKMHRDLNSYHRGHYNYDKAREGWPEVGLKPEYNYRRKRCRAMRSLVPDTAENRAALDLISAGFEGLLTRLSDLLSPEKCAGTLGNIESIKLLP